MTSTSKKYFLAAIVLASAIIFILCNRGRSGRDDALINGAVKYLGAVTFPDSSRQLREVWVEISWKVKYDSSAKKRVMTVDTVQALQYFVPLMDSTGKKAKLDSSGKPMADPIPRYLLLKKDSVFIISWTPLDTILKKK